MDCQDWHLFNLEELERNVFLKLDAIFFRLIAFVNISWNKYSVGWEVYLYD